MLSFPPASIHRTLFFGVCDSLFETTHKWDDNDLIVWDNRSMIHRGQPYDITEPRYLVRATVSDTLSTGTYLS